MNKIYKRVCFVVIIIDLQKSILVIEFDVVDDMLCVAYFKI